MACPILQMILLILLCFLAFPSCSGAQFDLRLASLPGNTDDGIFVLRSSRGEDTGLVCYDFNRTDDHEWLAILVCTELGYAPNTLHGSRSYQTANLVSFNINPQLSKYSFSCDSSSEADFRDCQFEQAGGNCYDSSFRTGILAGMTCLGSKITSCADRCDTRYHPHWECQCNNECVQHADCCSDFLRHCTRPRICDDGAVVVEEIKTGDDVGYVCHGGRFLSQEAMVVCKELGYTGMAKWEYVDKEATSHSTVISSYIQCLEGYDILSDCTFEPNPKENDSCPILAGVTCNATTSTQATTTEDNTLSSQAMLTSNDQTTTSTHATTTGDEAPSTQSPGTRDNQKSSMVIITVIVCIALCIVVALLVLIIVFVRRRTRRKFDGSDSKPTASGPTVDMATLTANQSAEDNDDALTALTSHTPLVMAENEYVTETLGQQDRAVGADFAAGEPRDPDGDNEYAYADIPGPRSERSTNPADLGYSDVAPARARQESDEGDVDGSSYGMVDNILYGTN